MHVTVIGMAVLQSDWRSRFRDLGPRNVSIVTRPLFHVMSGWGLATRLPPEEVGQDHMNPLELSRIPINISGM